MSRITQKSAVGPMSPWVNPSPTGNYTGTSTPIVGNQAYTAIPANGAQPSTGTGFYDANFGTYVGQKFDTSDGREVAIVVNGGVALAGGVLVQSAANIAAFSTTALAVTVPTATPATAGSFQILVTNGTTVINVNQYAGGYLFVNAGTGIGQTLKIASHQPAISGATFLVTLEDAIVTTLDTTSKVNMIYQPYGGLGGSTTAGTSAGVIVNPTTPTGVPVGATLYPIAASTLATYSATGTLLTNGTAQYGFIVTHGLTGILNDSAATTVAGEPVSASQATAGAVALFAATKGLVGNAVVTGSASTTVPVYLTL